MFIIAKWNFVRHRYELKYNRYMLKFRRRKLHLKLKWGLLPRVIFAIAAGIVCGLFVPNWFVRVVLTFNDLFSNFLGFVIPLLIVGLVAPGIMIFASALTMFFIGRNVSVVEYHFAKDRFTVSYGRLQTEFLYENVLVERNAENSDFFDKNIIKLSFIKNRIVLKNALNNNSYTPQNKVVTYQNEAYILTLDDYALALIGGSKNEL